MRAIKISIRMQLLSYRNLSLSFGGPQLLDCAHLSIAKQDRICLVGRNGSGKSSLLRLLNSELTPDKGEYECMPNLRIQKLDQPSELAGSVFDVVASGLGPAYKIVNEYNELLIKISGTTQTDHLLEALNRAESTMDTIDGWTLENKIERTLNRMDLEGRLASNRYLVVTNGASYSPERSFLIPTFCY